VSRGSLVSALGIPNLPQRGTSSALHAFRGPWAIAGSDDTCHITSTTSGGTYRSTSPHGAHSVGESHTDLNGHQLIILSLIQLCLLPQQEELEEWRMHARNVIYNEEVHYSAPDWKYSPIQC